MVWEDIYKKSKAIWGLRSDSLLMELAPSVPMGCVLDLGMGEGRNSLPFAAQGYELIGFDTAPSAIQKALDRAQEMQVSIEASVQDIRGLEIAANRFSLVISTMALQFMKSAESQAILERITDGLEPGGFVYITVFSTEDPMYQRLKATQPAIEKNTFFSENMNTDIHFFEKDDLLKPLSALKLHHFAQSITLDKPHGGVPFEHYHGILSFIGQKI